MLLERAVTAADLYAPGAERAGLRAAIASACLEGVSAAAAGSPRQRALAAGFAASAHSTEQLALVRLWLDGGSRPDGLAFDGDLRGSLLRTLAARGLASDDDLDALAAADPVAGEQNRATCRALRPDAAAKDEAWAAALRPRRTGGWRWPPPAGSGCPARRRCWAGRGWPSTATGTSPRRCRRWTGRGGGGDAAPGAGALPGHARRAGDAGGDRGRAGARRPGSATGCGWCCSSRRRSCVRCWRRDRSRRGGAELFLEGA